jgi:hypothetical protein
MYASGGDSHLHGLGVALVFRHTALDPGIRRGLQHSKSKNRVRGSHIIQATISWNQHRHDDHYNYHDSLDMSEGEGMEWMSIEYAPSDKAEDRC